MAHPMGQLLHTGVSPARALAQARCHLVEEAAALVGDRLGDRRAVGDLVDEHPNSLAFEQLGHRLLDEWASECRGDHPLELWPGERALCYLLGDTVGEHSIGYPLGDARLLYARERAVDDLVG